MNKGRLVTSLVLVAVIIGSVLASMLAFDVRPRLGLDLQGGIGVILSPQTEGDEPIPDDVLNETISVIRSRVDRLGVSEPEIARQGDQILVQLPGLDDPQRALEIIGRTAKLTFRPVQAVYFPGDERYEQVGPDCTGTPGAAVTDPAEDTTESPADSPTTGSPSPDPGETEGASAIVGASDAPITPVAAQESPAEGETAPDEPPTEPTQAETAPAEPAEPTGPAAQPGEPGTSLSEDETYVLCGSADAEGAGAALGEDGDGGRPPKYEVGPAALTGEAIDDALATTQQTQQGGFTNNWEVQLDLTGQGANLFADITGQLACERDQGAPGGGRLAIVLDGVVESAPEMNPGVQCGVGITGGTAIITVGGEEPEARDLALVLKTGALPLTLVPETLSEVSPTLGSASLRAGIIAGLAGLALVALYLIFFYRWLGVVAVTGLSVFGVVIVGLITGLGQAGFTLTLAGIAGVIVSIGIAADSSILYFERIQDELETGKTTRTSVRRGFGPAFRTNLTGNTVTIAAAIVLYFLAVGPVRGFAFTLGLSTALDLLILYFFTRPAVLLIGDTRLLRGKHGTISALSRPEGAQR